tara:strand:+ start:1368 stop:1772 length:405 start_codon:yes stop_codon:yes gene_type:complete
MKKRHKALTGLLSACVVATIFLGVTDSLHSTARRDLSIPNRAERFFSDIPNIALNTVLSPILLSIPINAERYASYTMIKSFRDGSSFSEASEGNSKDKGLITGAIWGIFQTLAFWYPFILFKKNPKTKKMSNNT